MSVEFNDGPSVQNTPLNRGVPAWQWRPLDAEFDHAVMEIAQSLIPDGFDVAEKAPSTYEELTALLDGGRRLKVWSGASGLTIYGTPEVNFAFRAWHDWEHWHGRQPFTFIGEASVAWRQAERVVAMFGSHPRARTWRAYVFAEVMGQLLCADLHDGMFPANQRRFVRAFAALLLDTEADTPPEHR